MSRRCVVAFALLSILVGAYSAFGQSSNAPVEIAFTVSMPKPHTHMLEVEVHVKRAPGSGKQQETLVMPVWTPGSYLIREFERHVQDFAAVDATNRPLRSEKTNKNSWLITTNGTEEWRARYRVYANELSIRTNELNSEHAFWNNSALLMHLDGHLTSPSTLLILAPEPWKIATSLPPHPGRRNTFRAENFDVLYDSPVEVGNFNLISFEVKGVSHRIVMSGEGNYDPERVRSDVKRIVETEIELMGGEIPYPNYTFIVHLRPTAGGGLEHLNSTVIGFRRFNFKPEANYRGFLRVVAHEFFHVWNVKRIRPDALGPFDYTKENYTKLLWVAEGITSYYTNITMQRAGFTTDREFLNDVASSFQALQNQPGRLVMTVEEASFDAWIKKYRPDENSINSEVDYYSKGSILGLLLDLEVRKLSQGRKSLDDVMRYFYAEFYKKNRNYSPADFQQACELMAGASMEQFFSKYVRGTEELDYDAALAAAGLRLDTKGETSSVKPVEIPYLGADLVQEGERLLVRRVIAGSPAYEQGLNTGDQIVALSNVRATKEFFDARIAEKRPGDPISLTIFRSDDLSTLLIKLGGRLNASYRIVPVANPTALHQQIYKSWLPPASIKAAQ